VWLYTDDPGPPVDLELTDATNHPYTLSWKPPVNDGGTPITGYLVDWYNWSRWEQVGSTAIEGLSTKMPDVNYSSQLKVRVYAVNSVGRSLPSECTFIVPRRDVPGCPEPPQIKMRTQHRVTLRIIPPADDGGLAITRYVVEMKGVSATRWRNSGYVEEVEGDLEFTVTGIEPSC